MSFNKDSMTRSKYQSKAAWYFNEMQRLLEAEDYEAIYLLLSPTCDRQASIHFQRIKRFRK